MPLSPTSPRAAILDGSPERWPADSAGALRIQLPPQLQQLRIHFAPSASDDTYHALRADLLDTEQVIALPVIPRLRMDNSVYVEWIDLLQELTRPWAGSQLRRWRRRQLRVALPREHEFVDYRGACVEAMELWNQMLGWTLFITATTEADIVCSLTDEARLAYAVPTRRDTGGRPLEMRLHLSPRWSIGAERYVRRTYIHEFGHAMGLWGHSVELAHIMSGRAVVVDRPDAVEVGVARWYWQLPDDFEFSRILRDFSKYLPRDRSQGSSKLAASTRCEATTGDEIARCHQE
jgi:hypothetical protein